MHTPRWSPALPFFSTNTPASPTLLSCMITSLPRSSSPPPLPRFARRRRCRPQCDRSRLSCASLPASPGAQADAAVFVERMNGLSLPNHAVVKALFLSGAEVVPADAAGVDGAPGGVDGAAAGVEGGGEGPEVSVRL